MNIETLERFLEINKHLNISSTYFKEEEKRFCVFTTKDSVAMYEELGVGGDDVDVVDKIAYGKNIEETINNFANNYNYLCNSVTK